ncbi:MAG: hypothetical protein ABEJ75_04105 [Candidatus Nanohaloarchaea archaeon]
MGWYALEIIEDALEDTRELLFPFNWKIWGKVAVIAFFAGGFGAPGLPSSFPSDSRGQDSFNYDTAGTSYTGSYQHMMPDMPTGVPVTGMVTAASGVSNALLLLAGLVLFGFILLFGFLGAVFSFVYYQSLLDGDVQIRKNFSRHFGKGVRLFGFRAGLTLLMLAVFAAVLIGAFSAPLFGVMALLAIIPLLLVFGVFMGLTSQFIPLVMMESGKGVIASWRQFWPTVREEWRQLGLYIIVRFFLQMGAGVVTMLAALALGVVMLVPFGLLAVLFYTFAEALVVIPFVLGIFTFLAAFFYLVNGPVQTYFRFYAIRMYHALTA